MGWSGNFWGKSSFFGNFAELFDDLLLVDVFEDVRGIDEKVDSPSQRHSEENVQLKTIDHQRNVLPVLLHLESKRER